MKIFTKIGLAALLAVSTLAASAATFTVNVGNNFYAPATLTISVGDVVNFVWQEGDHPTMSDSSPAAWATFQMNQNNRTRSITFSTAGTFPYHCTAHAFFDNSLNRYVGQVGVITVNAATPTSAAGANALTPALNIFPNPSRGQVTVQLASKAGQDYKLRLSNIIGKEIRTVALKPELTAAGLPLNLGDLPAGMYFYSLLVNDKVVSTKRLVLQN